MNRLADKVKIPGRPVPDLGLTVHLIFGYDLRVYNLRYSSNLYIKTAGQKMALMKPNTPDQNVVDCWMK